MTKDQTNDMKQALFSNSILLTKSNNDLIFLTYNFVENVYSLLNLIF